MEEIIIYITFITVIFLIGTVLASFHSLRWMYFRWLYKGYKDSLIDYFEENFFALLGLALIAIAIGTIAFSALVGYIYKYVVPEVFKFL